MKPWAGCRAASYSGLETAVGRTPTSPVSRPGRGFHGIVTLLQQQSDRVSDIQGLDRRGLWRIVQDYLTTPLSTCKSIPTLGGMRTSSVHRRWYARCVMAKERRDVNAQTACSYRLIARLIAHYTVPNVVRLDADPLVAYQVAEVANRQLGCTSSKVLSLKEAFWPGAVGSNKASNLTTIVAHQPLSYTHNYLDQLRVINWMVSLYSYSAANWLRCTASQPLDSVAKHYAQ